MSSRLQHVHRLKRVFPNSIGKVRVTWAICSAKRGLATWKNAGPEGIRSAVSASGARAGTPAVAADIPGADADIPGADADIPGADADNPVADADMPVADADMPVADADMPGADAHIPVADAAAALDSSAAREASSAVSVGHLPRTITRSGAGAVGRAETCCGPGG
jgi:nicotinate-nucleotide--dimethylbenzimidazole phosphoribosyltransferase